jgi:hypothetical protein
VNLLLFLNLLLLLGLIALLGLCPFMRRRRGRLVGAILIAGAITIRLAALCLRPLMGLGLITAAAPASASLRKRVKGQKNHRSDKKYAVFQ